MKKPPAVLTLVGALIVPALAAALALGVLPGREARAQVSALPLNFQDVVIFATNSVRLRNDIAIVAGHVVVNDSAVDPTLSKGVELGIGDRGMTPAGYSLVADRIGIGNKTIVGGDVFSNTLKSRGTIQGVTTTPLALPVFTPLPAFKSAAAGTQDVTVATNQVQSLPPGDYRDIIVRDRATLVLSPGVYSVRSINAASKSSLLFQNLSTGTSEVLVENGFTTGDDCSVGPDDWDPLKAAQIVFYVASVDPPDPPKPAGVAIGRRNRIQANFYVPNETLVLGNDTVATGQFLARDVDVGDRVRVDLEGAFGSVPPAITSANATTFTVGQAGSFTVTTTGTPSVMTITRGGDPLPAGVSYIDHGDGTATLSGTPDAGTAGTYFFTFTATNGVPPDAVQDPFTLTVQKQAQSITFTSLAPVSATVGGPTYNVTATATSGLAVAFAIDASASTVCTIAGSTVSFIGAGTCVINANQAGNGTFAAAPQVQQSFGVGKNPQTISFTSVAPVAATVGGPTYTVTAVATSGLPVAFTIDASASTVCTIAGSTVSFIGVGTCVIDANQAGNATYDPAPQVQQSFAVGKGSQTITFTSAAPSDATPGGATYTVTAVATSGLPVAFTIDASATGVCSISGSTVSFSTTGTCVINANQAGNANYDPAPQVQQSFAVKSPQTISFTSPPPSNAVVGGPMYNVTATATSGLAVAFTIDASATTVCSVAGSTVSFIGAGTCVINANQVGDASFFPAPQVQQSFTVKMAQTITFTSAAPSAAVYQGPTYDVMAAATSGLPVALTIAVPAASVCSIAGSTVSFIGTGICTINANQPGNATYAPAPQVQQSFTVGPNLVGDSYSVVGNTQLVAAGQSTPTTPFTTDPTTILANDTADVAIALTTVTGAATTGGGSITIDASGGFTYSPPVGQTSGTDTYVYIGTANGVSRTATITFNISNIVWYVDNASIGAHDGSSTAPFVNMGPGAGNLGSALSNSGPAAGAHIYVFKGSGTTTGAYAFKASQTLIGAGATLSVGALTIAGNAANTPTLGGTLTLANGVTTNGFDMSTGISNGIVGASVTGLSVTARDLATTAGTAVNIGGAGNTGTFSFRSITAGTGAGSPTNGITLMNLTGSFTVTGDGTNAQNGSGGTIQHMTGANGSTDAGNGIRLTNVQNVTLNQMHLHDFDNFAIRGSNVTGFTMAYTIIDGANGNSVADLEDSLRFDNLVGSATIDHSSISGGFVNNVRVVNTGGTLDRLNVTSSTIGHNSAVAGNDGMGIEAKSGGAVIKLTVDNSTFTGAHGDMIDVTAQTGTTVEAVFTNNTASNTQSPILSGGGGVIFQANGTLNFTIANNAISGARGRALNVSKGAQAGVMAGTIAGNTIGVSGSANSGSTESSGIFVDGGGAGSMTVSVTDNQVFQTNEAGIYVVANNQAIPGNDGTLNATIIGNTVSQGNAINTFAGIFLDIGSGVGAEATFACLDVGGAGLLANDFSTGDPANLQDIGLSQASDTGTRLPGYGGGAIDTTAIGNYLKGRNANGPATSVEVAITGIGYTGGAACALPSPP